MYHNTTTTETLNENLPAVIPPVLKTDDFVFDADKMILVDISGYWRYAQFIGAERVNKKLGTKGYKEFCVKDSTQDFNNKPHHEWLKDDYKSHMIGIFGELAYGLEAGLQPNMELLEFGDGNQDFADVDIKSCWIDHPEMSKYLIENCYKKNKNQITKYYVKAAISLQYKKVVLVGWLTGEELCKGHIKNYGKGNAKWGDDGNRFAVHYSDLNSMYTFPPLVNQKKKILSKTIGFANRFQQQLKLSA
ncbi:hypothetical protein ABID22_000149 [Pontibacter aydingkolensis]|uniref:Uracil DNA glycosylase superfamily protein n=1 Tax=Pontibacter aydingkolensis TaxID=1911536 RepID=A0ABS7CQW7_9BACT|nr:hypothetical protein [Pontibacter aydingkolensis]MBW7466183.1 hypothetical protein [Pontibacter aydingkolensis]